MRRLLRVAAVVVVMLVVGFWMARGRRGWTHNMEEQEVTEPVTGIIYKEYHKKFIPGVDFLAKGLITAAALGGGSYFFRKPGASGPSAGK